MKRRVLAVFAALVLAGLGAVLLTSYVGAADQRAMAGMKTTSVLVVTKPVAKGASAAQLGSRTATKELPAVAVVPGAVTSLTQLTGLVATTDLEPGEQLLASRFTDAASLATAGQVPIPRGLQEVSVSLDAQRVVNGHIVAGAHVGVFVSTPKDGERAASTHLVLDTVLVTRVEGGAATAATGKVGSSASGGTVTVTLALSAADAQRVVFGAEYGTLWLSRQPDGTATKDAAAVTAQTVDR